MHERIFQGVGRSVPGLAPRAGPGSGHYSSASLAGQLAPELAASISRVVGVKQQRVGAGTWIGREQASEILNAPDILEPFASKRALFHANELCTRYHTPNCFTASLAEEGPFVQKPHLSPAFKSYNRVRSNQPLL